MCAAANTEDCQVLDRPYRSEKQKKKRMIELYDECPLPLIPGRIQSVTPRFSTYLRKCSTSLPLSWRTQLFVAVPGISPCT
ncbi:hypothetical protein M404DRAFT_613218 [Pisolithus tinctorius Marx 270]|uniref:Uncharacterized protein n=1 Tax=Pisolithus tinctorius Marx 270 TaxID=870435 RepID=A0A0C3NS29_PISTI|nr:hypothetical protein M404DRAFT_613218 [Pisolithus tinctorius Marx 270]